MPKAKSIGERIYAARQKLKLTQPQAAKVWDISLSTLQAWEQGKRNPAGLYLRALEQILAEAGE